MKKFAKKIGLFITSAITIVSLLLFVSVNTARASSVALDGAAVSTIQTLGNGTVVSPSFNVSAANDGLIVFIEEGGTSVPLVSTVVGNANCNVTFVRRAQLKASTDANVEIWSALDTSSAAGCVITATAAALTSNMYITVQAVSGEDTTGTTGAGMVGATTTVVNLAGNANPSSVNTTTRANSWVFANAVDEFTNVNAFTAGSNQTILGDGNDSVDGFRYDSWKQNAGTVTSGTAVTMNGTYAGNADGWSMATIEIKGAVGGGGSTNQAETVQTKNATLYLRASTIYMK